jgi:hypothetical protein
MNRWGFDGTRRARLWPLIRLLRRQTREPRPELPPDIPGFWKTRLRFIIVLRGLDSSLILWRVDNILGIRLESTRMRQIHVNLLLICHITRHHNPGRGNLHNQSLCNTFPSCVTWNSHIINFCPSSQPVHKAQYTVTRTGDFLDW